MNKQIDIMKHIRILLSIVLMGLIFCICSCSSNINELTKESNVTLFKRNDNINTPDSALQELVQGNERFAQNLALPDDIGSKKRKTLKDHGQRPFSVIITCSDSRVPPELIFDQGLGDLFVIRVAGNVIDSVVLGSVQYAVDHLSAPLIVVLGHEKCGAVHATIEGKEVPGSIPSISNRILPSLKKIRHASLEDDLEEKVIEANVTYGVEHLLKDQLISHYTKNKQIKVLGAKYFLETGHVEFYE